MTLPRKWNAAPGQERGVRGFARESSKGSGGDPRRHEASATEIRRQRPTFAKLATDWTANAKLRRCSAGAVVVWWALIAYRARVGSSGRFMREDVARVAEELTPWSREVHPLEDRLRELEEAGAVVALRSGGLEIPGWNPDEWGTGYPRGDAWNALPPCPRCRGQRTCEPGRKSCRSCRERDLARWARRKAGENARRRDEYRSVRSDTAPAGAVDSLRPECDRSAHRSAHIDVSRSPSMASMEGGGAGGGNQ